MLKLKQVGSNQTMIETASGTQVFFSYETPVAAFVSGRGYVRTSQHYSRTTSKHITQWLAGEKAETVDPEYLSGLLI